MPQPVAELCSRIYDDLRLCRFRTGGVFMTKPKLSFEACGDYIYTTVKEPTVGTLGGEWVLYGLSHAGYDMSDSYRDTYLANVEKS